MTNSVTQTSRCRFWNFSIASIFLLTFSNILLTIRLLHYNNSDTRTTIIDNGHDIIDQQLLQLAQTQRTCIEQQLENSKKEHGIHINDNYLQILSNQTNFLRNFDLNLARWDTKRMFKLFDNILIGNKFVTLSKIYNVSLATQSSLEKLSSIVQVAFHWSGPISVGLYAAGNEEFNLLLLYLYYLQKCYTQIREQVAFHLLIPKDRPPTKININFTYLTIFDCTSPDKTLKFLLKLRSPSTLKWRVRNPYPQNHLRNLARKNCQTGNVFLTDVDIIPCYRLAEGLNHFLKGTHTQCKMGNCAYVIPTYELDERVHFPKNKTDLLRLVKKGLARPFHEKVFIYNQFATNISRWQTHEDRVNRDGKQDVHISHSVTNFEFFYEPFYVASDTVPPHDERFLGYGFTRNTQVYEMFVAGYEFFVLSPVFTCHWGLQLKKTRPHWRERQNTINARQFEVFKREIFARYNKDPLNMVQLRGKNVKVDSKA